MAPDMVANINTTVLMSGVDYFANSAAINPFMDNNQKIDLAVAQQEHSEIKKALEQAGVKVIKVAPPAGCQDGVYTANWALVRGDKAVLASLPNVRQAEQPYAEHILKSLGKQIIHLPSTVLNGQASSHGAIYSRETDEVVSTYGDRSTAEKNRARTEEGDRVAGSAGKSAAWSGRLRFSGQGDALPCGNYLLCGSGYRSDVEAQKFVAESLSFERVQLRTVPLLDNSGQPIINQTSGWADSLFYDIDLAISVLRDNLIAWCPAAFTTESQAKIKQLPLDKIEVSLDEAKNSFACNLVSTGQTVIMSANAPELKSNIEAKSLKTITPRITELAKGGGYIRCTSLTV